MWDSRRDFQQGEHAATSKPQSQGPPTPLLFGNSRSEPELNCCDCSAPTSWASQKGRHFFEELFIFSFQPSFFVTPSTEQGLPLPH